MAGTAKHFDLTGQHALVTGGGSGIGAAIAIALDEAGAKVSLLGRTMSSLEQTASKLARPVALVSADVTSSGDVSEALNAVVAAGGDVAILVNNAGAVASVPFARSDDDHWRQMLDVNLTSVVRVTRRLLAPMKQANDGRIINVASTAGLKGYPYVAAYCAAKHGVVGLTRALAMELASTNITVNAICPGYAETPLLERSLDEIRKKTGLDRGEAMKKLLAATPQGRPVQPEEVAVAALWLCSRDARSVTGQAISISGGEVM